jgi:hypothetical protein
MGNYIIIVDLELSLLVLLIEYMRVFIAKMVKSYLLL